MDVHSLIIGKLVELFQARNLELSDEQYDLIEQFKNPENYMKSISLDFGTQSYFITTGNKITKDDILALDEEREKSNHTIIIIAEGFTPASKNIFLNAVQNSQATFEFWKPYQLRINPLTHSMAPEYKILNEEEKLRELPSIKTNPNFIKTLPQFRNDAAVKWLGGKVGDIIRIRRDAVVIGKITDYRVVKKNAIM